MEIGYDHHYGRCGFIIEKFDMYGAPPPTFNIHGKRKVKTTVGFILTLLSAVLVIGIFISKIEKLASGN